MFVLMHKIKIAWKKLKELNTHNFIYLHPSSPVSGKEKNETVQTNPSCLFEIPAAFIIAPLHLVSN
jgi:hypothetical protein